MLDRLTGFMEESAIAPILAVPGSAEAGPLLIAGVLTASLLWRALGPEVRRAAACLSQKTPKPPKPTLPKKEPSRELLSAPALAVKAGPPMPAPEGDAERLALSGFHGRLGAVLGQTDVVVFEQDEALRYTWVFNAPDGAEADMLGMTDHDVYGAEAAAELVDAKLRVMASGQREEIEVNVPLNDERYWYKISIMPRQNGGGVVSTAMDISQAKESEAHLKLLLRELAHRTKNLMTVIDGIARQTAKAYPDIEDFQAAFSSRLHGLAATHDLLIKHDWRKLDLKALIDTQVSPAAGNSADRVFAGGPATSLGGEKAQHIGLALHELATNALKYGALSVPEGSVHITWSHADREGEAWLDLLWEERDGPAAVEPEREGFGTFLTTRAIEAGLDGEVERCFGENGFRWHVLLPLD